MKSKTQGRVLIAILIFGILGVAGISFMAFTAKKKCVSCSEAEDGLTARAVEEIESVIEDNE